MKREDIKHLVNKSKKCNQVRLIIGILLLVFALPCGKFCGRTIKNLGINNPTFKKIFQTYDNIQVTTSREKELKQEIDRLVSALKNALIAMAGGTGVLVILIMGVSGMNFIQRYLSDKQYIKIIEELCDARESRDTL